MEGMTLRLRVDKKTLLVLKKVRPPVYQVLRVLTKPKKVRRYAR